MVNIGIHSFKKIKLLAMLTALFFDAITCDYSQVLQACSAISCSKAT